ncbi:hypothetical protein B0H10DRAFT_177055 [Mycena sp. CBHHK59/15]|nr:hypothetical protein B0H10DRAFT_177055 [Mycena sp. CBHHK59/15]
MRHMLFDCPPRHCHTSPRRFSLAERSLSAGSDHGPARSLANSSRNPTYHLEARCAHVLIRPSSRLVLGFSRFIHVAVKPPPSADQGDQHRRERLLTPPPPLLF